MPKTSWAALITFYGINFLLAGPFDKICLNLAYLEIHSNERRNLNFNLGYVLNGLRIGVKHNIFITSMHNQVTLI